MKNRDDKNVEKPCAARENEKYRLTFHQNLEQTRQPRKVVVHFFVHDLKAAL
jgi:hypothetical protein